VIGTVPAMRVALFTAALIVVACAPAPAVQDAGDGTQIDFGLNDVNPASARFDQVVKPSDYRGKVSAWYFGHSG